MRKKILFFNGYYPNVRGGAELQAKIIAEQCLLEGYEVVFISIEEGDYRIVTRDEIKVHVIPNPNNRMNNLTLYYFFMQRMQKIIEAENPTIIYQRIMNSFSPYLAKYAKGKGIPFILHIANTHCFNFTSSLRDKVRFYLFKQLKKYPVSYIAQTKEQEELLVENGLPSSLLIPNFYKTKAKPKSEHTKPLKVLWIANIRPVKQVEIFFQLAKDLAHLALSFEVIGRIEKDAKREYYYTKMKEIPNLHYLGEKSMEEVDTILEEAFLLLNTSRSEGFSNTFVQAWAKGTPVVSLNSDPNAYLMEKRTGTFANGDYEVLKNALIAYTEDAALYNLHSLNASSLYLEELSFENSRNKLIDFFENFSKA